MKKFMPFLIVMVMVASAGIGHTKEPVEFTEDFFNLVKAGKISDGFDQLFVGSRIPEQKPQAVTLIKQQTASGLPLYGKIVGLEKIREEKIGQSIVRLVYVLKSEMAPTIWEFYFYKPQDNWFLANIVFNDQFNLLRKME